MASRLTPLLTSLCLDLRYALRMMARTPGLTAVLLLTLAIGIGATTTIFSVVESWLVRPLPYDRPEQLVRIYTELAGKTVYHDFTLAPAEYVALGRDCRSCAQVAAWRNAQAALAGGDHPVAVRAAVATSSLLPMIGVRPLLHRRCRRRRARRRRAPPDVRRQVLPRRGSDRSPASRSPPPR